MLQNAEGHLHAEEGLLESLGVELYRIIVADFEFKDIFPCYLY